MSALWHPFTQHGLGTVEVEIARAKGAYLYTREGRAILDGISSWWVTTHGHRHPRIVKAVQDTADRLDQIIFAGFTHDLAQDMAQRFLRLLAPRMSALQHIFLSDSGSTAVEAALKMAIGFHVHTKTGRSKILALKGGYHGDTFGAMSVGERGLFTAPYAPYLFEVNFFDIDHSPPPERGGLGGGLTADSSQKPPPNPPLSGGGESGTASLSSGGKSFAILENLLQKGDVAAVIVEPLIQAAGGMRFYAPSVLREMADLCKHYGVLFIADEVMTGWGRTGTLFACEQAGITPDILCTSKGLTGGFLGMGATVASEEVYQTFYSTDRARMFFHSSSYTGNPLACAAAAANMAIWEQDPPLEHIEVIEASHAKALPRLAAHPNLCNVRQCGTVLAVDVRASDAGYLSDKTPRLYAAFMERDVLLRPLGNTIYILPPYCITAQELERCYKVLEDVASLPL